MSILALDPLTLIISLIAVLALILYFREYFLRKKAFQEAQKIDLETKQKSIELLKAAELAQIQVISQGDYATQKLISEFKQKLETVQEHYIKFMSDLQKQSADFEEASKAATQDRINQLFERLENKLSDFLLKTEQNTTSSIELELKAARQLIETYKTRQLKLIDENIIAMMEQTLNIVLAKKLSLNDQLDLVYEALEKAKLDKFVV